MGLRTDIIFDEWNCPNALVIDLVQNLEDLTIIDPIKSAYINEIRSDLTDDKILESDYYYLMPNDIIYIEPLKGKQFTFAEFPYALIFAAISTTLLLINYFQ